jgi:hypothetical protein|tara:strand:+ start:3495 stop:3866 length:372 start_codon:yes stop_codon:yes gene_type:complete
MNFNQNVEKEVIDVILESSLWSKANIDVKKDVVAEVVEEEATETVAIDTVPEYANGVANEYEEPENPNDTKFTLDDLQVVLDNLEEDDLMEHAMSMLEVFDVAYEHLAESEEEEEAEETDEEE